VVETAPIDRSRIGSVQSIEPIRTRPQGSGAGAVVGGVLGAVVGHQFGSGVGRVAMTGLGAAGGAVAGNNVERNHNESISGYRVSIRLDNGTTRTFERSQVAGLQVGDRVRLDAESFHRV
jgi:outer membrane lipoprotein SlyB